jgi:serine/threonine protein kinase
MGAVWAAMHTVTGRAVAMKFVRGPAHLRSELRTRFLREARASTTVQHPNVVDVFVNNVRKKLETEGESRLIHTVRGVGYALRESNAEER